MPEANEFSLSDLETFPEKLGILPAKEEPIIINLKPQQPIACGLRVIGSDCKIHLLHEIFAIIHART
jgi:hypothetical protein